ncbi:hypothetical protein ACFVW5_12770 [Streptomyces sp. NPDC058232]|uniref:hypothetical protein n=1 Tax=Streptomyces sp. NPDC058232 TaxID=3346393 RepID=UPI0036EEF8F3
MTDLKDLAIAAHGGTARWNQLTDVSAQLINGGVLWPLKGAPWFLEDVTITVQLHHQEASHAPFRSPLWRTFFTAERVMIVTNEGEVIEDLRHPRASFRLCHVDVSDGAVRLRCARLPDTGDRAMAGERRDLAPPQSPLPNHIATHSREQVFYFDRDGLLRRHDYDVEVSGSSPAAHYVTDHKEFNGIVVPTTRRVYLRQPDGSFAPEPLVVSIDLRDVSFR